MVKAFLLLAAGVCLLGGQILAVEPGGGRILTRIADIRALPRAEAQKALPVKVRGVVTLRDLLVTPPEWFVLDDGDESIWVQVRLARDGSVWQEGDAKLQALARGDLIELEGTSHPGGYAPVIVPRRFQLEGRQALPEPRDMPLERLLSGAADCQLVELEGVVQSMVVPSAGRDRVTLNMESRGQTFHVIAEHWPDIHPPQFIDAQVRVRGIFSPVSNFRAEMVGLRIRIVGPEDVKIVKPPPADPFQASRVSLDRLRPFSPQGISAHRCVTQGVVTYHSPGGFLFVQDGDFAARVQAADHEVSVGDQVEVAGFVDMTRRVASLHGARVRRIGQGVLPQAIPVTARQVLSPQKVILWERVAETDLDGRLVKLDGRLDRIDWEEPVGTARLQVRWGEVNTTAHLRNMSPENVELVKSWEMGSRLELTGICEIVFVGTSTPLMPKPASFHLWLRSPADVQVVHAPPWWTPHRLALALLGTLLAFLLVFGWSFTLHRTLRRRTALLEEVMSHHRNAELELQSAQQERRRLATDLHDGLQQMITGISYRLEAAIGQLERDPDEAHTQLAATRRALTATKTSLRECLWGLRQVEEGSGDFATLLRHVVAANEHWPAGVVTFETEGRPFRLSRDVMGGLLLLVQEAVSNALRHGAAGQVRLRLLYTAAGLELEVNDDGRGFDPRSAPGTREGHYGLEGMRQRMNWLGGSVEIKSQPAHGTSIRIRLPQDKARTGRHPAVAHDDSPHDA